MNKIFKYYAIAPLTLGNIFTADKNPKLKDIEIIWNGTKYTCDLEDDMIPSKKNFFTKDQLKEFIKDDTLSEKIIKLFENNIDKKGDRIYNNKLYFKSKDLDGGKFKLYIDEMIETNNLITINGKKLGKYYITPLETIDYLIQESLEELEFDSEDEKNLAYNQELLDEVKNSIFVGIFEGLIKSYQIGTDAEVNIDECLNLEDVKKIYQGIKNGKNINIKTIKQTYKEYEMYHDFSDENKNKKWEILKKGIGINLKFLLNTKDLGAYLQKKLDISEKIGFNTRHNDDYDTDNIIIEIPEKYLVDKFLFNFKSENYKKYIKADICNKVRLELYDFKINPSYEDIVNTLNKDYGLDDSNYTLQYKDKTISKGQKIIKDFFKDIGVILKDNTANKEFLTDKKPKKIILRIIGKKYSYICIYLNDFKNNELLKWAHEHLKFKKKTNDISKFDIKFYKDEAAKEEIQIPNDDSEINFEYKEDADNVIYISIYEKEKEKDKGKGKREDHTNNQGGTEQTNSGDGQGTKVNETKDKKKGYCAY